MYDPDEDDLTYADLGKVQRLKWSIASRLGIDPTTLSEVDVEVSATQREAVVTLTVVRRVPLEDLPDLLAP